MGEARLEVMVAVSVTLVEGRTGVVALTEEVNVIAVVACTTTMLSGGTPVLLAKVLSPP